MDLLAGPPESIPIEYSIAFLGTSLVFIACCHCWCESRHVSRRPGKASKSGASGGDKSSKGGSENGEGEAVRGRDSFYTADLRVSDSSAVLDGGTDNDDEDAQYHKYNGSGGGGNGVGRKLQAPPVLQATWSSSEEDSDEEDEEDDDEEFENLSRIKQSPTVRNRGPASSRRI
jgi:hypothetical protein